MRRLTARAVACLRLIEESVATAGYAPSCSEIKMALDLPNVGVAARVLKQLEVRGHIRRIKSKRRAIELLNHSRTISCPNCNHEFEPARATSRGETPGSIRNPSAPARGEISEGAA